MTLRIMGAEEKEESFSGKELECQIKWDALSFMHWIMEESISLRTLDFSHILLSHVPYDGVLIFLLIEEESFC